MFQDAVDGLPQSPNACAESAERHGVVCVTTVPLERDPMHLYLVVAGAVLRELPQALPLEEVQGLRCATGGPWWARPSPDARRADHG